MKILRLELIALTILLILTSYRIVPAAQDEVGKVAAIKGNALIDRDNKKIKAKVKEGVLLKDTVSTLEKSMVKMRFIDDSILTLGEKSKVIIKEFVYSKEKEGKSIFNLIDGKMKSIVGKTKFEVRTSTAVAAARGTVIAFEVGIKDKKNFTTILCLDGEVVVSSANANIIGRETLRADMIITIFEGERLPSPSKAPPAEIEKLRRLAAINNQGITIPAPEEGADPRVTTGTSTTTPPGEQQRGKKTVPVNINIRFP
ncbi:MAG: FecR domain-containing protein [Nitrospirae bacterium]|nr:FecR domain-containing protein [Nitrospirota bacterium]